MINLILLLIPTLHLVYKALNNYHERKLLSVQKLEDTRKVYQQGFIRGVELTKHINLKLEDVLYNQHGDMKVTYITVLVGKDNWVR